jgi:hypothetical protein
MLLNNTYPLYKLDRSYVSPPTLLKQERKLLIHKLEAYFFKHLLRQQEYIILNAVRKYR